MEIQADRESEERRSYEPPRVESALTAEQLAREVQYAGELTAQAGD